MSLANKIENLNNKKINLDKKITVIENRLRLQNSKERNKLNNKKKSLAKIFLSSNFKLIAGNNTFSIYEIYTIGGLIIMHQLDKYKSTILLASYNQIVKMCLDTITKNIIYNQGKQSYLHDRKINKDIHDKLCLINGILIRAKRLIEDSDLEYLHQIGNNEFIKLRKLKLDRKHQQIIASLKNNIKTV
ncbi:hypothetical protein [Francisella sp. TX07-6608]|uniref:hypothetical protein n=1 Tax=Francisella sp. TX07-6608 TaxID=573568 RepID=UPI0008F9D3FA|nr:hypothetical protein [Francisella sp. TX07-6608]OIN85069.1 hypothetical protein KX00_2178 [Francisella sp. TX07-6608]